MAYESIYCYVTRVTAMPGGKVIVGISADPEHQQEPNIDRTPVEFYVIENAQREMLAVALAAITSNILAYATFSSPPQNWPPPHLTTEIERLAVVTW